MGIYITKRGLARHKGKMVDLERTLAEMQKSMGEATKQSSETWHDNAPLDILKSEASVKISILQDARRSERECAVREYPKELTEKTVQYGVRVVFDMNSEESDFNIVGFGDSDPEKGRIFYLSPLAQGLMGHKEGEEFTIEINKKKSTIRIKNVCPITDPDLV